MSATQGSSARVRKHYLPKDIRDTRHEYSFLSGHVDNSSTDFAISVLFFFFHNDISDK